MRVGSLNIEFEDGQMRGGIGKIAIAGVLSGELAIKPVAMRHSESRSPTHDILFRPSGGSGWGAFGVAWFQEPQGGGENYFSVSLQNPRLPKGELRVNIVRDAACTEDDKTGEFYPSYDVLWSPPGQRRAPAAVIGSDTLIDDEVPY